MVSGFCHFTKSWVSRSFDFDVDELKKECGLKKKIDQINRQRSLSSSHSTKSREIDWIGTQSLFIKLPFLRSEGSHPSFCLLLDQLLLLWVGFGPVPIHFVGDLFRVRMLDRMPGLVQLGQDQIHRFPCPRSHHVTLRKINKTENLVLLKVH